MKSTTKARKSKPIPKLDILVSPEQHTEIVISPALFLKLVIEGNIDLNYLHGLAGFFNLLVAITNRRHQYDLQAIFDRAQSVMQNLIADLRAPTSEESQLLRTGFSQGEKLLKRQTLRSIFEALTYVDQKIMEQRQSRAPSSSRRKG